METLIRKVMMPDGAVRSEHRVTCVTSRIGQDTLVDVESSGEGVVGYVTQLSVPYDGLPTEDGVMAVVMGSELFAEWADPVDQLLPILTDEQAEAVTNMYPEWAAGTDYAVGIRVQYDGRLYRCVQAHTSQEGWGAVRDARAVGAHGQGGRDSRLGAAHGRARRLQQG